MKEEIFKMYSDLRIGENEVCKSCRSNEEFLTRPLSIYHVGENFSKEKDTILFVGKTAIGGDDFPCIDNLFSDGTPFGTQNLDMMHKDSKMRSFYSYTHDIIEKYYGDYESGKKNIALTNMVKCNDTSTEDLTTYNVKDHCINKIGVIWKEIEILKPRRIIFYTGRKYDDYIDNFEPIGYSRYLDEVVDEPNCIWHRRYFNNEDEIILDILRVYHPQRQDKEKFIGSAVSWLKTTKPA
jgi:hypothetical protein